MNPQEVAYLQYVMAVYGFTRLFKGEYTAQEFAETLARAYSLDTLANNLAYQFLCSLPGVFSKDRMGGLLTYKTEL